MSPLVRATCDKDLSDNSECPGYVPSLIVDCGCGVEFWATELLACRYCDADWSEAIAAARANGEGTQPWEPSEEFVKRQSEPRKEQPMVTITGYRTPSLAEERCIAAYHQQRELR